MKKSDTTQVFVVRNGSQIEISSEDVVVGDIVQIKQGMMLPADCILTESFGIVCDESSFTGESEGQNKEHLTRSNERTAVPILLKDSLISSGFGKAIVIAVGERTQSGQMSKGLELEDEETPLQAKLNTMVV